LQPNFGGIVLEIGSVVSEEKISFKFHPLFSIFGLVAILVGSRDHRTQFWKEAIQGQFHQCPAVRPSTKMAHTAKLSLT
jgi:hypothetical protein